MVPHGRQHPHWGVDLWHWSLYRGFPTWEPTPGRIPRSLSGDAPNPLCLPPVALGTCPYGTKYYTVDYVPITATGGKRWYQLKAHKFQPFTTLITFNPISKIGHLPALCSDYHIQPRLDVTHHKTMFILQNEFRACSSLYPRRQNSSEKIWPTNSTSSAHLLLLIFHGMGISSV